MRKIRYAAILAFALAAGCAKDNMESLSLTNAKQVREQKLKAEAEAEAAKQGLGFPAPSTSPSVQTSSPV